MNLGNKIRELRRARGLTQEQLAQTLNISAQAVSKWEMGASYPDMTMIPVIASVFKVSLDELFDFDVNDIDKKIEDIIMEKKKYFWSNFEKAEQILLDGLEKYPASILLKTELFDLYAYNVDRGDEIINKAFELAGEIIQVSQDVFCTCRTKANMIHIYTYLERERNEDHYEDIKKLIESLPYMYPYMLQDRMRLSADFIKGEEGMRDAKELKNIEWQEFFLACWGVGNRYFKEGDYENAMLSYQESVDVIERFMYPNKKGYGAYPIGGTHANHAMTILTIAACMYRLGRTEGMDALIEKAKGIYFDALGLEDFRNFEEYKANLEECIAYFTKEYDRKGLNEYKPLDLGEIKDRIK